jgi:hypothetical protein
MPRRFWRAITLGVLVVVLAAISGYAAQQALGCVGDWKSYRSCLVAGRNVAHWVFGVQSYALILLFYFCFPLVFLLVAVEFALSVHRDRKR